MRIASPRQRPESSSTSDRSSSIRGPRTAPSRSNGSGSAYGPLPGSSMWPRAAPLPPALALCVFVAVGRCVDDRLDRVLDVVDRRLGCRLVGSGPLDAPEQLA